MQMINIKKLKRDYFSNPLIISRNSNITEFPHQEDLKYLYIDLNLTKSDLKNIFKCSLGPINKWLKIFNIVKPNEKRIASIKTSLAAKKLKDPNYQKNINRKRESTNLLLYKVKNCFQSEDKKLKAKNTYIKNLGVDNPSKSTLIKEKKSKTTLKNWGVENPFQSKIIISKIKDSKIKNHTTNYEIAKDKYKQYLIREKTYNTKKLNKSFKSSKLEAHLYKLLLLKFPNTKHIYRTDLYPFNCDFYIPELDLYIEYNGHWTHGPYDCHEPFDKNNTKHILMVQKLFDKSNELNFKGKRKESFLSVIDTWTVRDPLKRKTAKDNNLNWLEFFTLEDFMKWYNSL